MSRKRAAAPAWSHELVHASCRWLPPAFSWPGPADPEHADRARQTPPNRPPGSAALTVHADREGPKVSPLLYGIFFEDINCSADGGIYAELVRNRSFEDSDKPEHWSVASSGGQGQAGHRRLPAHQPEEPEVTQGHDRRAGHGPVRGSSTKGYWGMAVKQGEDLPPVVAGSCRRRCSRGR